MVRRLCDFICTLLRADALAEATRGFGGEAVIRNRSDSPLPDGVEKSQRVGSPPGSRAGVSSFLFAEQSRTKCATLITPNRSLVERQIGSMLILNADPSQPGIGPWRSRIGR